MTNSSVYFIAAAGHIKIGTTTDLLRRFKALQSANPESLSVLAAIPGDRAVEAALHDALIAHRVRLEWFKDCAEVRQAMNAAVHERGGQLLPDPLTYTTPLYLPPPAPPAPKEFLTVTGPVGCPLVDTIAVVSERFTSLINAPEVQGAERDDRFRSALQVVKKALFKFGKVSDEATLRVVDRNMFGFEKLCARSTKLIDQAENAFAYLFPHRAVAQAKGRR